jgi:hypothetical protein
MSAGKIGKASEACGATELRGQSGTTKVSDNLRGQIQTIRTAAGTELQIPSIHGDGAKEIREMRGEILRANIAKSLDGSHLHMKVLFEYAGLWPAGQTSTEARRDESSLAALLLEKLEGTPQTGEGKGLDSHASAGLRTNDDQQ